MKQIILLVSLLQCATLTSHIFEHIQPIKIESKILTLADGKPHIIRMGDFIDFQKKVGTILSLKMPTEKMPARTFQTIVALEEKLSIKGRDAILNKFIHQFAQIMQHIFDDLALIQNEVAKLIEEWSILRDRPDTLLPLFATKEYLKNHEAGLKKHITTLSEFNILLQDLHLFFKDLIYSLPKSRDLYEEALKKSNEQHEPTT